MPETKKRERLTTPRAALKFSNLLKPNTKFAKGDDPGNFDAVILLTPKTNPEHKAFMAGLKKRTDEAAAAQIQSDPKLKTYKVAYPYKPDRDAEGNETGNYTIRFKTSARNPDGTTRVVPLFDASGQPVTSAPRIGRGTEVCISYNPKGFAMPKDRELGLTMYLNAVQILKLVEYVGGGSGSYGFQTDEEGWTAGGDDFESDTGDESASNAADTGDVTEAEETDKAGEDF